VFSVLATMHVIAPVALVAAVMAVVQVQNVCDPTNTQNVWVANFTGVGVDEITKLTLPFQVAVASAATLAVVLFGGALLGTEPFHIGSPAGAATADPAPAAAVRGVSPGLFARDSVARTVAVRASGGAAASLAAGEIRTELARGWGFGVAEPGADPEDSDCALKPFVALLGVATTDAELTLSLSDCAAWPVEEWSVPRTRDVRADALAALFRMRTWTLTEPERSHELFARGLAFFPGGETPTYYYSLFKTSDGKMRMYVRPGGPAYDAGFRTNDVVERLDGKEWWEYGTFQTQARAYDGLPHRFLVTRGAATLDLTLGAPFRSP
jgi:hypothetical protein